MAETIELEIISSIGVVLKTTIRELYIPAYYGEAGVLENHLPYITLLRDGEVVYEETTGKRHHLFVEEGVMHSAANRIQIISDSVETVAAMDAAAIQRDHAAVVEKIRSAVRGEIGAEALEEALRMQSKLGLKLKIIEKETAP